MRSSVNCRQCAFTATAGPNSCSARMRPMSSVFGEPDADRTVLQGRDQRLCRQRRREAVNPARRGTKAAAHYQTFLTARRKYAAAAAPAERRLGGRHRGFRRDLRPAPRRSRRIPRRAAARTSTTPRCGSCIARRLPGCCGRSNSTISIFREWLDGDPLQPPPAEQRKHGRNADWRHLNNADIISMPDKWEYPVVRRLGPRFSCGNPRRGRSPVRQAPAAAVDA